MRAPTCVDVGAQVQEALQEDVGRDNCSNPWGRETLALQG